MAASARRTVQALRDVGEDVRVLSCENDDPNGPQPEFPLKMYHFPIFQPIIDAQGFRYASTDKKVLEKAIRWADVVHMEEAFVLEIHAVNMARKLGKPITATYHIHPENIMSSLAMGSWRWANDLLLKFWRNWIYNYCTHIQCPTISVYERLRDLNFKANLRVISNGLIPDKCIRPADPPAKYLDPERPLKVIYIGRMSVEKDQPTFIKALRHSAFAKRIQICLAGQGPEEKAYTRMAMKLYKDGVLKYKPIINFYSRDELRTLAAEADLCVHCATIEVEGLSIMEAMQQALVPVIAKGRISGAYQFALDDRSIFREKDPRDLAQKMDWWLEHPQERWEQGKLYAKSMEEYDIAKSAAKLIEMFKEAVAEGSK